MAKNEKCFTEGKAGEVKCSFFPRQTGDIVVDILDNLSCAGTATVRVAAFAPHRDAVAQKLRSLADQGCSVRIVHSDSNDVGKLSGHGNTRRRRPPVGRRCRCVRSLDLVRAVLPVPVDCLVGM
ncbi:hypothetical protein ACWC10_02040 [Streptomyces sp. NPDC001595]|uniref:hypothetical protein n=1 Tax=Streptomyces sp. NPDC001532 TaxID=3154520 RepID=UPI00331A9076